MASAPSERMVEHALTLIVQSEIAPDPVAHQARLTLGEWRGKSARHLSLIHISEPTRPY